MGRERRLVGVAMMIVLAGGIGSSCSSPGPGRSSPPATRITNVTDVAAVAATDAPGTDVPPLCSELEAAAVPALDGPLSVDGAVAAAQRWRAGQGLASDASSAAVAGVTRAADGSYPVTEADRVVLARRDDAVLTAAARYGASFGDTYGGVWWSGGVDATIGFTDAVDARRDELASRSIPVSVVTVAHSLSALQALEIPVRTFVFSGRLATAVGVRPDLNAVTIEASGPPAPTQSAVARQFGSDALCIN